MPLADKEIADAIFNKEWVAVGESQEMMWSNLPHDAAKRLIELLDRVNQLEQELDKYKDIYDDTHF